MLDRTTHLFRLQTIVAEGSMRKAAEVLGITQPPLSRSVALLEKHYGRALLHRHTRGVEPTEFGERVLAAVKRLARNWELAEEELSDKIHSHRGTLRLRAGPLWRAILLPKAVSMLHQDYPAVSIEVESGAFSSALDDLQQGRTDVIFGGIHAPKGDESRLIRHELTVVRDRIIARKGHPIFEEHRRNASIDPQRLLEYPWIVYTADPAYEFETIDGTTSHLGRPPDIRVRSQSLIATMAFLQSGDYLCILPDAAVAGMPNTDLFPVPVDLNFRIIRSGVLYRVELQDWPPMQHLIALCQKVADVSRSPK